MLPHEAVKRLPRKTRASRNGHATPWLVTVGSRVVDRDARGLVWLVWKTRARRSLVKSRLANHEPTRRSSGDLAGWDRPSYWRRLASVHAASRCRSLAQRSG